MARRKFNNLAPPGFLWGTLHHEAHEEHEGKKHFYKHLFFLRYPIFVTFVVNQKIRRSISALPDFPHKTLKDQKPKTVS
jgi:hypothetical protein